MAKENIVARFKTKERAQIYVNALNNGMDIVNAACNTVAEVAKRFDGKVYNRKFCEAVNVALSKRFEGKTHTLEDGRTIHVPTVTVNPYELGAYDITLRVWLTERDVQIDKGYATYFDSEISSYLRFGLKTCFDEGKRIKACEFEREAQRVADANLRTYARYRDALLNWDKHVAKIAMIDAFIKEQLADLNKLFVESTAETLGGERMRWLAKDYDE